MRPGLPDQGGWLIKGGASRGKGPRVIGQLALPPVTVGGGGEW